ncbi:hypothetical protein [Sporolactobacillus shoreicorticis]|uniref:Holin n=1 Tax=Sporolactobacillus shoreicorticis TaxID=1923877 RepID=A0ABW5S0Q5_9BACL|nr:hypothetical protein [Sporolactobacillus shoreicorticis]
MATFGIMGFMFGICALGLAADIESKYKKLEQRVKELEDQGK